MRIFILVQVSITSLLHVSVCFILTIFREKLLLLAQNLLLFLLCCTKLIHAICGKGAESV